jgi:YYY domain-containing protein
LLIAVLGNLEGALEFGKANGIGSQSFYASVDIANLAEAPQSDTWYPSDKTNFWWWWRATRVCPDANCIMEFPFFSFLLGDLHPHVMAVPFVLTSIGLAIAFWLTKGPLDLDAWASNPPLLLVTALLIGGLGFLNTWDLPTFGSLAVLLIFARNLREHGDWPRAIGATLGFAAPLGALAVLAYLPFYATFGSQAEGLEAVAGEASRPLHTALIWLPLGFLALPVPLLRLAGDAAARTGFRIAAVAAVPAALLLLWAALLRRGGDSVQDAITARGWDWLSALAFAFAFLFAGLALWRETERRDEGNEETSPGFVPMLALTAVASLLLLGAEFFFIGDVFNSRLNTVFKLYYQAWLLLGCAAAFGAYWLVQEWRVERGTAAEAARGAWAGLAAVVVLGALLYPLGATLSRTDGLGGDRRTLDGLAFTQQVAADDASAVDWLKEHAGQDDVILEAVLGQYTLGGRISARSGVPAVLGWPGHETQWARDGTLVGAREADVNQAYSTTSLAEAVEILRRYNVTYVIVGSVERTKYPAAGLQKFSDALPAAHVRGNMAIYRLPPAEPRVEGASQ